MLEIGDLSELKREVFGPVLHVLRYRESDLPQVIEAINATGYGLTHGLHTRIDEKVAEDLAGIRAGNIYVNRNIVGAVVGVQPFGGHGLSGTGPKAGGPLYLHRLCRTDKPPELHGEPVPVAFDALRALEQALPDLADLPPEQARRLRTRIRHYRAASPLNVKLPLPGPTGEDNSLWFEPRGVAACLAPALQPLLEQLAAAFATHNDGRGVHREADRDQAKAPRKGEGVDLMTRVDATTGLVRALAGSRRLTACSTTAQDRSSEPVISKSQMRSHPSIRPEKAYEA